MRTTAVILFLVATPTSAFALDQSVHESISHDSCVSAGLPQDFCERVGTEAYNVDSYEWDTPEAHAQISDTGTNSTACNAANATLERARSLGSDIRASLVQLASGNSEDRRIHIATQLGRVLHTIQDDCAHKGMPNLQHAWASRMDTCTGSKTSPDAQPEAASCARTETAAVFAAFRTEMATAGVSGSALDDLSEGWTHWPTRDGVCKFLRSAEQWDGADHRWESTVVVPWLRNQLTQAITTDGNLVGDACAAGVDLQIKSPSPLVNVSTKPPWCFKLQAFCIGKADAPDEPPPWDDSANDSNKQESAGCAIGSRGSASWMVVVLAGLALVTRRRRR
jgi:hypothetical protein